MFSRYNRTLLQKVYTIENWKAWLLEIKEKKKNETEKKKNPSDGGENWDVKHPVYVWEN